MKTTIASILVFTGLVLYFGVEKPEASDALADKAVAAQQARVKAGPSEFAQPTTIAPKGGEATRNEAAAVSQELPVEALSAEALKEEIQSLQQYAVRENAIERLNQDSMSPEERVVWGKTFERLLALRSRQLRLNLESAQAALAEYKNQHEERVAAYTGTKS